MLFRAALRACAVILLAMGGLSPALAQNAVNTATITPPAGITDPDTSNNSATDSDPIVREADLALAKTASPDPVAVGAQVSYLLTVSNNGPSPILASDTLILNELLPAALSGCVYTPSAGTYVPNGSGPLADTWTGVTLASGASVSLTIACTVGANAADTLANSAILLIPTGTTDPDTSNNQASASVQVVRPQLTMAKTASATEFVVGQPAEYTLRVDNTGTAVTTATATISDTLPASLDFTSGPAGCTHSAGVVTCVVPAGLPAGDFESYTIVVTPNATAGTTITNTATVSGGGDATCPAAARCSSSVTVDVASADLAITKSQATPNPALPGQLLTWTVTVTNNGPSDAPVTANDTVPAEVSGLFVGGADGAACSVAGQVVDCDFGTVPGGESRVFTISGDLDTGATGDVSNSATVATSIGDPDPSNNASTSVTPVIASSNSVAKTASPASGSAVRIGDTITYTLTTTIADSATTQPIVLTDTLDAGLTPSASVPPECVAAGQVLTCTIPAGTPVGDYVINYNAVVNASAGASVGNSVTGGDACPASCATTHTVYRDISVSKAWVNGIAGDAVTINISGDVIDNAQGSATVGAGSTPATAKGAPGATINVAEAFTTGDPANYVSTLACTRDADGGTIAVSGAGLAGSFTMPDDSAVTCTFTNSRASATLQLSKQWIDALPGDTATVGSNGFTNDSTVPSTADATGNNVSIGTPVTVYAGDSGTIEEILSNPSNYDATLACSGNTQPLSGTTLTIDPADTAIECTWTNERKAVNLVLQKTWLNAAVGETAQVTATGSATSPIALDSVADTATETDNAQFQVYAGETITLAEAFGVAANGANYDQALACTGNSQALAGNVLTVDAGDTTITCTFTNTRLSATLQLAKAWGPGSGTGDVAQIGSTTGLVNNTGPFSTAAPLVEDSGTPVTVYAGEQALLPEETMSGGVLDNYGVVLSCTGGVLSGSDGKSVNALDILPSDSGSSIVCTYTNNRTPTTLTLQKVWLDAIPGDRVQVGADRAAGGLDAATIDSTAGGGATETITGTPVDVYAGEVISMAESFTNGTNNNYDIDVSCSNTSGFVPATSVVGGTLTVGPNDGPITCTWTNDRKSAQLIVQKVWAGPSPGASVDIPASSGFTNNTPAFSSDFPNNDQVGPVEVFVQENGTLGGETFTTGAPGDFTQALTCDGSDTDPSNGLAINVADAGTTITCTYSNTFVERPELTVDKSSGSTVTQAGDVVTYDITVTNTGNVPVNGVTVTDPLPGLSLGTCTPALPADLDVGDSITCTATYAVTQADIDRNGSSDGSDDGTISNTATASGTTDGGDPVTDDDSEDVVLPAQNFTADFTKDGVLVDDADGSGRGSAGDTIGYSFSVTNTGNTTIASVTISDPRLPGLSCDPSGPVAPGQTVTFGVSPPADVSCTGNTYVITQADIDSQGDDSPDGRDVDIDNTATGTFVGPNGGSGTADATDQVPIDPALPILQIQKTANPTSVDNAGDIVTYTFVVTNPGNVTIEGVTITDGLPGLGPITCGADTLPTDIAPGDTVTCTAQYTITQADIDAGGNIVNTAEADGSYDGDPVTDDDQATVNVDPGPGQAELVKTADKTVVTSVGEIVTYTFSANNPSARTLLNVQIIDDTVLGAGLNCDTIPTLAPSASATFTCTGNTYAVQQSDIDNQGNPVAESGELVNTATAQAEYIDNGTTVTGTDTDSWTVDLPPRSPQMLVTKVPSVNSVSAAGDPISYAFQVENIGNTTLLDLQVADPLLPGLACDPVATLAPGDTATFTCTGNVYTVTQDDIDTASSDFEPGDNQIDNVATVTAGVPGGTSLSANDQAEVNLPVRLPAISLAKSADVAAVTATGTINYTFTVTNTGNVTITGLDVSDPTLGLSCPTVASLAPGASVSFGGPGSGADQTCTGTTRAVTQAELDAGGTLDNTATASGLTDAGGATPLTASDTLQIPINRNPALAFDKTADVTVVNNPGDPINYTITGTNTGNVTLSNVDVGDPLVAGSLACVPATPIASLAPGDGFTCTGTYLATQDDFDTRGGGDGVIENTATATWTGGSTTDGANVDIAPQTQSLTINKTAGTPTVDQGLDPSVTDAGDTIPYTIVVENTGNVTLSAIAITDPNLDSPAVCDKADIPATSPPDSVTTCTGVHTITQAEVDVGQVTNSATAQGTPPGSSRISSLPDTAIVILARNGSLELTKTAGAPTVNLGALATVTDAGDQVTYTFSVQNTGNVTLRQVDVADALMPATNLTCAPTQLAPGQVADCGTATYMLLQSDIDAGIVTNDATATGLDPTDATVTDDASVDVTIAATPVLSLVKTASPTTVSAANDTVTYSFEVTNAGNVTVDALSIVETGFSGTGTPLAISCPATTLAPQATTTCTATYAVTQADIDAGIVTNSANATGTAPDAGTVTSPDDDATVTVSLDPELTVTKSAAIDDPNGNGTADAGEIVTYTVTVQNTGNVTLANLAVADSFEAGAPTTLACAPTTLAPADTATCTAYTHLVTQAEVDAGGTLDNTATATADPPTGAAVTGDDSASVPLTASAPELTLVKTVTPTTAANAGDVVAYSFEVTNTGNVTIDNVAINETVFSGTGPAPTISCPATTLAPGASTTCTSTDYAVTQDDVNAGVVDNTAQATGTDPGTNAVTSADASAQVTIAANAELTLVKTVTPTTAANAGDVVAYSFEVTNTGNVTIDNVAINETVFSGTGPAPTISCPATTLAPGASTTCTSTDYAVTQDDVNAGVVDNTAQATGTDPGTNAVTSADASAQVTIAANAELTLVKTVTPTTAANAGDVVAYSFEVTNTGNVTIDNVAINETVFSGTGPAPTISCPATTLAPGASTTCTSTDYAVTQDDVNAGVVDNTAQATGTDPGTNAVTSADASAQVTIAANAELTLVKTVTPTTAANASDVVAYSFEVTNTGNVTIDNVAINETVFSGTGPAPTISCPATTLAPGASTTCTSTDYAVTQDDVNAGVVDNTAQATGTDPGTNAVTSADASAQVTIAANAELTLVKTVTPTTAANAGDVVAYSFEVTNTGNVTIDNVAINETVFSGTGPAPTISCPATTLAPGASTTCTSTDYAVTQDDVNAGVVDNTAQATGTDPGTNAVTSADASAQVTIAANAELTLVKTVTPTTAANAGDVVAYSFEVTNTGNVTIDNVAINETVFSGTGPAPTISCPATTLAPGASTTCTSTDYAVTQDDVNAGVVDNTAQATGTDPGTNAVTSADASAQVTIAANAELTLVKTVTPTTAANAGDVVAYSFEVTNTGNVTIDNVAINETVFSGTGPAPTISCPATTLAPGASTTCTSTDYAVTQDDVNAGVVDNTAQATGTDPGTNAVTSADASAQVTIAANAELTLVKTVTPTTAANASDVVAYSFEVTNTGNVTIDNVAINETVFSGTGPAPTISCPATTLAPGASTTCTSTDYAVTQDDVNAGVVDNTAQATGTDPGTNAVTSADASAQVTIASTPALALDKTASVADTNGDGILGNAGDTITYAFSMQNTGNVTLAPVTVDDPMLPALDCTVATLDPGATATCAATGNTYVITVADETSGTVDNTATATGDAPGAATDPTATDTETVPTEMTPAATTVVKEANPASGTEVAPGDTIEYTVTVTVADSALHEAVTLTDTLSSELTLVAVTDAGAFTCGNANPLVCTLPAGTVPGAYPVVYTATVNADATRIVGNTVVATKPPGVDPDPVCTVCTTGHSIVPATTVVNKSADPAPGAAVAPGDTITYTVTTVVSGSALTQPMALVDRLGPGLTFGSLVSADSFVCVRSLECILPAGTLPGTYEVVYTATVDADATGQVANNVTAENPRGGDPDPDCQVCDTDHAVARPSLETAKTMSSYDDLDGNGEVSTGDVLTYTVTATNTGNVPLANVTIDDPMIDPDTTTCPLLTPGAVCTLEGTYTVTQADTDAGQVVNDATSSAEPEPGYPPLPPEACPAGSTSQNCAAEDVTPVIQRPAIATTKTADLTVDTRTPGVGNPGDVVTYSVTATNTGNVTLANVVVTDSFQGGAPVTLSCAPSTLAPGQTALCDSYDHTITDDEAAVDSGQLVNEVLASGDGPQGGGSTTVTATAEVAIEVQDEPATVRIVKTAVPRDVNIGDIVRYTLVMQNTSDVDVVDGTLVDTPPPGFTYVDGSLTVDDGDDAGRLVGTYPIRVDGIDIVGGERATVTYMLRVGAGVGPGIHVNRAFLQDDGETVSNVATAEVQLVSDPMLDESLILGTVFNDRDGDGWQDGAAMTDVHVQGGFAPGAYVAGSTTVDRGDGPVPEPDASAPMLHGLALGTVGGRASEADPVDAHQVVVSQTLRSPDFTDDFVLTTGEGIELRMDAAGEVTSGEAKGDAAKGLTAAAPVVERRVSQVADGYRIDYVIRNEGIDERGVPGVRIATVEGLLVETDQYGRYHLTGIDGGAANRGRNFIMKIDPVTLPPGTAFVTDNPQVRRITPGVPVRFDFGVQLPPGRIEGGERIVELELGRVLFAPDSAEIRDAYRMVVTEMADQLLAHDGAEVLIEATAEDEALGYERARAVQEALLAVLPAERSGDLVVTLRTNLQDEDSMLVSLGLQPVLGTILFDTDKSVIKPQYVAVIDRIAEDIEKLGGGVIGVVGHADRRGPVAYNDALGMRRARAVYEAIAAKLGPEARSRLKVEVSDDPTAPVGIRGQ